MQAGVVVVAKVLQFKKIIYFLKKTSSNYRRFFYADSNVELT